MANTIFEGGVCNGVTGFYGFVGLFTLIMLIILYTKRNHAGIATRHPFFSMFHCSLAIIFFWIILPSTCLIDTPFLLYYMLRIFVVFSWFWASLCRYKLLQFDSEMFAGFQLGARGMVTFSIKQEDRGNTFISGFLIGLYFILCFIAIIVGCSILNAPFDNIDFSNSNNNEDGPILQIELVFTVMCIFPFAVIMFWVPHSIWDIKENWHIRDELVYIFMATSILFFWDTAATAFNLFLRLDTVLSIKFSLEALMLAVTVLMCTVWVIWKTPSDTVDKAPEPEEMAQLRDSDTLTRNDQIPLAYVLVRDYGYKAFLQHCVNEINVENLQFLSEICYFKKKFLERIEKLHMAKLQNLNRQSHRFRDDESVLGNFGGGRREFVHRFSIPDERISEQHRRVIQNDKLIWSPCNSLTILTLKMKHGLEELPELRDTDDDDDDNSNNNKGRGRGKRKGGKKRRKKKNNLYVQWRKKQQQNARKRRLQQKVNSTSNVNKIDIEDKLFKPRNNDIPHIQENHNSVSNDEVHVNLSADNRRNDDSSNNVTEVDDDIPLYVMGYALYLKFIKEGGDSEVNISSKTRTHLHYFFHPSNLLKDDETPMGGGNTPGRTPGGVGLQSVSHTPKGGPTRGGPFGVGGGGGLRRHNQSTPGGDDIKDGDNEDLVIYEFLKDRENPNSSRSYTHLYKLYHIFDGAWAEIFHLIVSNVYPRFTANDFFHEIKDQLKKDLTDETQFLKHLVSRECNEWFETVKPRSLIIIGVDKIPVDEQISYFGKPLERVNRAVI